MYSLHLCLFIYFVFVHIYLGDVVASVEGRATDLQFTVVDLSPGLAQLHSHLDQATYTCVPLPPSSLIWYWPRGFGWKSNQTSDRSQTIKYAIDCNTSPNLGWAVASIKVMPPQGKIINMPGEKFLNVICTISAT